MKLLTNTSLFLAMTCFVVVYMKSPHLSNIFLDKTTTNVVAKKKLPKLQRIGERWAQEYAMTYDKKDGGIPTERLWSAKLSRDRMWLDEERNGGVPRSAIGNVNWVERGPNNIGGRTRAVMFDPNDANNQRVFAGSVSGGLWVNNNITDANTSWVKINDFLDNLAIGALAYDPNTTTRLYAGTGEGFAQVTIGNGIYFSTDNGVNWAQMPNTSQFKFVNSIVVRQEGGSRVVYVASKRIYIGPDLGVNGGPNFPGSDGLFRTDDDGATWTQVLPLTGAGSNQPRTVDHLEEVNGVLYASTGSNVFGTVDGDIHKCTTGCDNAANWSIILDAGALGYNNINRTYFTVSPSNPNTIYAMAGKLGAGKTDVEFVLKTTNGGTTWTSMPIPTTYDLDACTATADHFTNGQATYDMVIKVHPTNPNLVILGGLNSNRSTNGLASTSLMSAWYSGTAPCDEYMHADQHGVYFRPGSPNEVVFSNDGGVYYSPNAGNASASVTFESRVKDYNVTQAYSADISPTANEIEYIIGLQDNGTIRLNGNTTGIDVNNGGDGSFVHIDSDNGDVQIASYIYNDYSHTDDAFSTSAVQITPVTSTGRFINPTDYDNVNNILYGASNPNTLSIVTGIGGSASLTDAVSLAGDAIGGEIATSIRVSPNDPTIVYLGNESGKVYKVTNANTAARSSAELASTLPAGWISSIDVEKGNENHLLVTLSHYGIVSVWESVNNGASWIAVEGNLPDIPVRWGIFNPYDSDQAFLATDLGVWSTDNLNGGATDWGSTNSGLANVRVDMLKHRFNDGATRDGDNVVLIAATYGRGVFTANILNPVVPVELTYFSTEKINENEALITWATAVENNSQGFSIERKTNGEFEEIGFEEGAGYSNGTVEYSFIDKNPEKGNNYYRLKQLDFDGKFDYSEIQVLKFEAFSKEITISPNPSTNNFTIQLKNSEDAIINILRSNGSLVETFNVSDANSFVVPTQGWNNGIYYAHIKQGDFTDIKKLVLVQ